MVLGLEEGVVKMVLDLLCADSRAFVGTYRGTSLIRNSTPP